MAEGGIGGMGIEAALKSAGWPGSPEKLQAAMENLNVDLKGLRGGPIVWTKDNHFRTHLYYRVYHWDGSKIARVQAWKAYEVKYEPTALIRVPTQHAGGAYSLGTHELQLITNIVVLASIYSLIACGYVLIYRVSRALNLAHGELMMLGAYLLLATASLFSSSAVLAIAAAVALSATSGVLVYVLLMRKMTGEMVLAAILTTVALGILVRGVLVLIWSSQQQYPAQALHVGNPTLAIGSAHVSAWSLVLVLLNAAVYGGVFIFFSS